MSSTFDSVVNTGQEIGIFATKWTFFAVLYLLFVSIVVGAIIYSKNKRTQSLNATLDNVECSAYTVQDNENRSQQRYKCQGYIKYTVNDKKYNKKYEASNLAFRLNNGETVSVSYDPANPEDTGIGRGDISTILSILVIVLVIASCITGIRYYLATEYKVMGVVEGASAVADVTGLTGNRNGNSGIIGFLLFAFIGGTIALLFGLRYLFS